MFGHRHCHQEREGQWASGRRQRRGPFAGFGFGGKHGMGGGDMLRAGRMLAQGDLRLLTLALVAEQPRHGYDIIKALEERTAGWYAPSPGIVYPTLTYLEEVGYLTAQPEGSKKLYGITEEGRAHLEQNRDFVDAVLERLTAFGEKVTQMRRRFGFEEEEAQRETPDLVRAAFDNLREVARGRLRDDADLETGIVEILARAAAEVKKL